MSESPEARKTGGSTGEYTWPGHEPEPPSFYAGWPEPPGSEARPAPERLSEPRERLDPRARKLWFITELVEAVISTAIAGGVAFGLRFVFDYHWRWVVVVTAVVLVGSLIEAYVVPGLRWRQWRYEIREDEVDLAHGIVVKTRQLIPMSRIQHVDTRRGPLQRRFGLASVVFFTAAGSMEIPALSVEGAAAVRDQIAELAKVHDDL